MDASPANRYNIVPRLVEASRLLGLPLLVPTDEHLVDRTTVEQAQSADPGTSRATTTVTVVINIAPPLYLSTGHGGPDGVAGAVQAALSSCAINADPAALRRDPGSHMESIIRQSATHEAAAATSDALIDGERWDGFAMRARLRRPSARAWRSPDLIHVTALTRFLLSRPTESAG